MKFMVNDDTPQLTTIAPRYDPTLEDAEIDQPDVNEPKKLTGKVKLGYEISEAEQQRMKFMEEMQTRAMENESQFFFNNNIQSSRSQPLKMIENLKEEDL